MKTKTAMLGTKVTQWAKRQAALKKFGFELGVVALACLGLANVANANGPSYTSIDYPNGVFTLAVDINSIGQIVGRYTDQAGVTHGFLLSGGTFTSISFPGASFTRAIGINVSGDIVGDFTGQDEKGSHGYLLRGGVFTTIDYPNAAETLAIGINSAGDVAGYYRDRKDVWHGFVLQSGTFTTIDFPRAKYTEAWGINDVGQVAGRYAEPDGTFHLYKLSNGGFVSYDFPGAVQTAQGGYSHKGGLNNLGDIVNNYASASPFQNLNNPNTYGNIHGLVLSGNTFTSIDFPNAVQTLGLGINDGGFVVGAYRDGTGVHGFLRTP
jgi:hypothetical protein